MYKVPLNKDRDKLHQVIGNLHEQGWGYTKIHKYLRENGYNINKSRTCESSILKKMKNKDEFISQPIMDGFGNFRVEMKEV